MKKIYMFFILWIFVHLHLKAQYNIFHRNGAEFPKAGNILLDEKKNQHSSFENRNYILIQFSELPGAETKMELKNLGIILGDYISKNTFYASVLSNQRNIDFKKLYIYSITELQPLYKLDNRLLNAKADAAWALQDGKLYLNIHLFPGVTLTSLQNFLTAHSWITLESSSLHTKYISISIAIERLQELAQTPFIQWIEPIHPPLTTDNLPGKTLHGSLNINQNPSLKLTGKGINIGEWDGGYVGSHIDFGTEKKNMDSSSYSDHSTHVAGILKSKGLLIPYALGMAPNAFLYSYDYLGDIQAEMDTLCSNQHIHITNNSYGYDAASDPCPKGNYDGESKRIDELVRKYNDLTHVYAAGNAQVLCSGGFRTVSSGHNSSKNVITVGAVNYKGEMSNFSSWGPVRDGRLKPEICAVGVGVFSTLGDDRYIGGFNGTSMATPGAAGTIAQLYERYISKYSVTPDAATMKTIVCNTAKDGGNLHPDFKFGFGIINAVKAVQAIDNQWFYTDTVSNGNIHQHALSVPANVRELKLTLAWTDKEGSGSSQSSLVNDLDIYIVSPIGDTIRPWVLDTLNPNNAAIRAIDHINNIEQVTIDSPVAGNYTIYIEGFAIPFGPQGYSVSWLAQQPELQVIYPNGGEKFNPGETQTLRWSIASSNHSVNIYYSSNNGGSWNTVASNITNNYYDWTVPNISSNQVLIKVTSNAGNDSSDAEFTIFPMVANLIAKPCFKSIYLTWNNAGAASLYRIYKFNQTTASWQKIDSVLPPLNNYTDTVGLVNGTRYYYTVTAVHSSGYEGLQAFSAVVTPDKVINKLVSTTGSNVLLCGDTITLNAVAAKNYLWTTGATGSSIKVTKPGTYQALISYDTYCTAVSEIYTIYDGMNVYAEKDSLCSGNSTVLHVQSPQLITARFTEVVQNKIGYGAPTNYPAWVTGDSASADYVEVSNIGDDTLDMGGLIFEQWNDTGIMSTFSWPAWVRISPAKTSVLHIGKTAKDDSLNLFFNTGSTDDLSSSGDRRGYILRDSTGYIVDAFAMSQFVFPAASGVKDIHWQSRFPAPNTAGYAGVILKTADNNRGDEWTLSAPTNQINLGVYNSSIKKIALAKAIWTDGNSFNATGSVVQTPILNQTTNYTAQLVSSNCSQSKSVKVNIGTVSAPTVKDSVQCGSGAPLCVANGSGMIKWYADSLGTQLLQTGGNIYTASITQTTNFWVSNTSFGCESPLVKVTETVKSNVTSGNIVPSSSAVCIGAAVTLNLNGVTGTIEWQEYNSGNNIWVAKSGNNNPYQAFPYDTTKYRAIIYTPGCTTTTNVLTVTTIASPTANISATGPTTICEGNNVQLNASIGGGYKYQWQKDTIDEVGQTGKTYLVTTSGNYRVVVKNSQGCASTTGYIKVTVNPSPILSPFTRFGNTLDIGISGMTYQWYNNGIPISGATSQTYTFNKAGSYTVKVTNSFGCASISQAYKNIGVETTTIENRSVYIYPNPSSGVFMLNLRNEADEARNIVLTDVQGRIIPVTLKYTGKGIYEIDIQKEASGVYILQLNIDGDTQYKRLIKQ